MAVPKIKLQEIESIEDIITQHASSLSAELHKQRIKQNPPIARRSLRKFTSGEVAKLIGVNDAYLRKLSLEGKGPQPETTSNGRRLYNLDDVNALRAYLDESGKADRRYVKRRSGAEHLQVISVVNFKGGSGKTTTAAHLAQFLALNGYRVLAVDLDPQASLSALHGYQPEFDIQANETLYGAIRYDAEVRDVSAVIRETYIPNLHIIPGNLELMEFEHETPKAITQLGAKVAMPFTRMGIALSTAADNYDVVIIDCPPQLGFLTLGALCASTAMLVTVHPQMLDVMSMCQFLTMTGELMRVVRTAGGTGRMDWLKYLVTRFEPGDAPQNGMVSFMRTMFGDHVLNYPMLKSTAISDAGVTKQTLYEVPREQFTKATYDRAIEAMTNVNSEIEGLIRQSWGRE